MTRICVLGDSHIEHIIAPLDPRQHTGERPQDHCIFRNLGGAALLHIGVRAAIDQAVSVDLVKSAAEQSQTSLPELLVEFDGFDLPEHEHKHRWRMKRVWGWTEGGGYPVSHSQTPRAITDTAPAAPDVSVIYERAEAGHEWLATYVRDLRSEPDEPIPVVIIQCQQPKAPTSVIAACPTPAANEPESSSRPHIVAVVHANSLRDAWSEPVPGISALSCDRAAVRIERGFNRPDDTTASLASRFAGVDDLIIVLGAAAMVWCRREPDKWTVSVVYHTSGVYDSRQGFEDRLAYGGLVTVSLAKELAARASRSSAEKIRRAMERGLATAIVLCRRYQAQGLRVLRAEDRTKPETPANVWTRDMLALSPKESEDSQKRVANKIIDRETGWTLLRSASASSSSSVSLSEIATAIVRDGIEAAEQEFKLPVARFGKWVGIDTEEIEGYQSLRRLMWKYVTHPKWARPLSLASFGPPGSGKSYGVKQVAASLQVDKRETGAIAPLEFNFGGFSSVDDLHRALHVVRDASLRGDIPLVMFDEFDATLEGRPHGWLKYLLAPMQDGTFRDDGLVFHVGRAIFVFVGGVSPTFDDLAGQVHRRAFVEAKGPDFVSRLRGHVNVRGPDRIDGGDDFYIIRRAVILRGLLEQEFGPERMRAKDLVRIHPQIIKAFLDVGEYRHGVRSMEAIIDMGDFTDPRNQFAESALPLRDQLDMHTDAFHFLAIVRNEPTP